MVFIKPQYFFLCSSSPFSAKSYAPMRKYLPKRIFSLHNSPAHCPLHNCDMHSPKDIRTPKSKMFTPPCGLWHCLLRGPEDIHTLNALLHATMTMLHKGTWSVHVSKLIMKKIQLFYGLTLPKNLCAQLMRNRELRNFGLKYELFFPSFCCFSSSFLT